MTRHSIVRSPRVGWEANATSKGAADVTMIDAERAATEVVLGVDTHLDVPTWRWPWIALAHA